MNFLVNKYKLWMAGVILLGMCSCNKLIEAEQSVANTGADKIFSTEIGAQSAVRGMYSYFTISAMSPHAILAQATGLCADEFEKGSPYLEVQQLFFENRINPNATQQNYWDYPYNLIYQANNLIERVESSTGIPAGKKPGIIAEGKFLRALTYFYLVNLYGDVPLATSSDFAINASLARSPATEVYALIVEDLTYAKNNLTDEFLGVQLRNRATRYAASALLARVHLYLKQYTQAELAATEVIGSGLYELENALQNVFFIGSKEAIFCLSRARGQLETIEYINTGSNLTNTEMRLRPSVMNLFDNTDKRKLTWTRVGTGAGTGTYAPFKFRHGTAAEAGNIVSQKQILRYAEVLLIRAEARNELNKSALAIADLDLIRDRAGISLIALTNPTISQNDLRDLIFNERAKEFFAEGGHRWLDLKRRGDAYAVDHMTTIKPGFNKNALLFPIPNADRLKDPKLTQNEGYQ